jgi:hypothetical protein
VSGGFVGMQKNLSAQGCPVFVSLRRKINTPEKVTKPGNFHKHTVYRTMLDFCDKRQQNFIRKKTKSSRIKWDTKAHIL